MIMIVTTIMIRIMRITPGDAEGDNNDGDDDDDDNDNSNNNDKDYYDVSGE